MEAPISTWFRFLEHLPPIDSDEFNELVDREKDRCLGGVEVNGIHISGWLYFHLNHWHIRIDSQDKYGNITRINQYPDLRDNEWIRADAMDKCRLNRQGYMEVGLRQGGKDLLNSSILYQQGKEIQIGDCNIGDQIYDDSGKLTTIIGKYPQGIKPVYKMTLVDGREINCGLDHNWFVYDRIKKKNLKKTTRELLNNYKSYRESWKDRKNPYEFRYSIPTSNPVEYEEKNLPVDPYFIGLWLGDGSNTYPKITTIDDEIVDYLKKYANKLDLKIVKDGDVTYMLTSGIKGGSNLKYKNPIHTYLKEKLYNNKHIPSEYLYSSIEQRMELLRGLMDSDGSCDNTGSIEFSSTIPKLANDFEFLCRSLGINVTRNVKPCHYKNKSGERIKCKNTERFILHTSKPIFKLDRKLKNQKCKPKYEDKCAIIDIKYMYDDETTCIEVNNKSHLFLTDGFTITHNSEFEASFTAYNALLFENTQNVVVGGNAADLSLITDKLDHGLNNMWEGLSIPRIDKDWKKPMVKLGYKDKKNDNVIWSYIIIRNADGGDNTEAPAGTTSKSFIMDEVGKYGFGQTFEAAKPAFLSQYGWRTIPVLVGTGGSFENGADAERFFNNPDANNFLAFEDKLTGKRTCLFMSGIYRQDCKYETTLDKFLIEEYGIQLEDVSELSKIKIRVADKELARSEIEKERLAKAKDPNRTEYLKVIMYHPLTPEECFLSATNNMFNAEAAKRQKEKLIADNLMGIPIEIYNDGDGLTHKFTDRLPILEYPLAANASKEGCVVMYEPPIKDAPFGLYVAGVDPYKQDESKYSDSLGSVFIFKRMHNIMTEKYQDMFVAEYTGRPKKFNEWAEIARNLIKYYNATALIESEDYGFVRFMIDKGEYRYLMPQPVWLKMIVQNSSVTRDYGLPMSKPVVAQLNGTLKTYTEDIVYTEYDDNDRVIREHIGFSKILVLPLLDEIIKFNPDGNYDRIRAASIAIEAARRMDADNIRPASIETDPRLQSYFNKAKKTNNIVKTFGQSVPRMLDSKRKSVSKLLS